MITFALTPFSAETIFGTSVCKQINLLDSKELQQKVKLYLLNRGPPEHWAQAGPFKRAELQKALGNHLSWKER